MSEEKKEKPCKQKIPEWIVTFADLMSLLVVFFVLIISFSTMDQRRFYDVVGSVKDALGVDHTNILKAVIEIDGVPFLEEMRRLIPVPVAILSHSEIERESQAQCEQMDQGLPEDMDSTETGRQASQRQQREQQDSREAKDQELDKMREQMRSASLQANQDAEWDAGAALTNDLYDQQTNRAYDPSQGGEDGQFRNDRQDQRADDVMELLNAVLAPDLQRDLVSVEERDGRIMITFPDAALFQSGSAGLAEDARPLIQKVANVLAQTSGPIAVVGHTDDVPISTARFPSNWELSTARATSVLRGMEQADGLDMQRLMVMGFADKKPVAPNDTPENRAKNRRVEIILRQP